MGGGTGEMQGCPMSMNDAKVKSYKEPERFSFMINQPMQFNN